MAESAIGQEGTLRFAIAGLGSAGCMMIPAALKHPNVQLTAAADLDEECLGKFRDDFQAEIHPGMESLCQSPNVDAIYIATPTQLHTDHALLALNAGKHVVLEKPMALTLEDADAMIQCAERNGRQLVVGHSHSYETPIRRIRDIVRTGRLGELRMIHNWYYTDWIYRLRNPEELDTSLGGGITFRQGSHQFDIIRTIGGGMLRSVRAMTGRWDPERPAEGSHTVFLEFEDGTPATAVYNGYDRFHTSELTFGIGEQGQKVNVSEYARSRKTIKYGAGPEDESSRKRASVRYGGARSSGRSPSNDNPPFYGLTVVSCQDGDIRQSADGLIIYGPEEREEIPLATDESGRDAVISELYEAVVNDHPPAHSGQWGKANLEVCLAVLESAENRKEVYLSHQVAAGD